MGFTFGNRRVVSKDPHQLAAAVDGDGAGEVVADPVVVPSKQNSLPPQSPKPIGRTSSSLFPWRKSKRQERNPEVSEAEARAVLASKRQEPPFEIHIPSTPHRSLRAPEAPYSVVPAASATSAAQSAPRRIGSDIPIHALPVVMTEKELNPCLAGSDDEEDTTTNPSCTDLDLSSTTEEGFETLGGKDDDNDEVMGRAGTPVVWEMEEGDNPRLPRVPIVHVKVSAPSPQRNTRRSQSPLRMMVTPKESSTPTTPLSPPLTFSQAAAAASAASATAAVVTPPSHQARATHPPRMSSSPSPSIGHSRFHTPPPPNPRSGGPDREGTPLPFDQPERFMELTHAVRRMLVATCEQDNDDGPDNNAAAAATTATASSTPIAKNRRPTYASHQYEEQQGPTTSAFGFGLNGIQGYMPAYWDAPCGAGAYRPTEQPQQQQSQPQPPTPAQSGASCHPVLMGEVWQRPPSSNRISPAATASLLCRPPPGIGSWTCGTMSPADGRPCVTGVLSVDDMDSDSLVDEEDRHQPPKPKAETTAPNGTAGEIQDPEEELVARSSGAAKPDSAPVKAEPDPTSTVVKAPARGSAVSASPVAATKKAPEAEARERSSSPRCTPPASTLAPDEHPDDERVASMAAKPVTKPPTKQPKSLILQTSRGSSRSSSSAPPSPGRVRFDDNPQEVRYLKSDEDEHTITCLSLVENSVTDPSEVDDDDDDDLYDDDDDDDLYDDSDDVESMDSAEYVEFLRHRKERRFDDCSASAAEQSGCSEHYAEYQKHRRKRRLDRGLKGDGSGSTGGGGCNGDGGEFSLTQELSDLFNDCTYLFRFFNDQYLGIGGTDGGGKSSPRRRKGRRRRRSSPSSEKGSSSKSAGATVKVRRASVNEDGTVTQAAAIVA